MIDSLGIYIGNDFIYISGIEFKDDAYNLGYYEILGYGSKRDIAYVLNNWYKKNWKEFSGVKISINAPTQALMRVVSIEDENSDNFKEKIEWEKRNFLLKEEDYTYSYDVIDTKAIMAFVDKDELLDFLNSLDFNVSIVENSVIGLYNTLQENHSTDNSVTVFCDKKDLTLLSTIDGVLNNYEIIKDFDVNSVTLSNYFAELSEENPNLSFDVFLSGFSKTTDILEEQLKDYKVLKLNPFISVGQTDEIIAESNISVDGPMLPISIAFSLNCLL